MPLNIARLRAEVLEHLGIEDTDLDSDSSNTVLDELINRSWWEICDKFDFKEKEASASFSTVAGTRSYDLPTNAASFEALQYVAITDPDTSQRSVLQKKEWHWYEQEYNEDADNQAIPEYYLRKDNDIYLYPTPDDVYTVTLHYLKTLADLSDSIAIPQSWHEIILLGAVWRGFLRQHDVMSSQHFKRQQISLIESQISTASKEDRDNRTAGVTVWGREY